eukprot:1176894-Prorocentrum_minimum.AAC.2
MLQDPPVTAPPRPATPCYTTPPPPSLDPPLLLPATSSPSSTYQSSFESSSSPFARCAHSLPPFSNFCSLAWMASARLASRLALCASRSARSVARTRCSVAASAARLSASASTSCLRERFRRGGGDALAASLTRECRTLHGFGYAIGTDSSQAPESTVGQPCGSLSAGNIRRIFGGIFEMPCAE